MTFNTPQENYSSTRLLFDVLRNHEDLTIRNASNDGLQALSDSDNDQLHYSFQDISEALKNWELHPALRKQLTLSTQELAQNQSLHGQTSLDQGAVESADADIEFPEEIHFPVFSGPSM